VDESTSSIEFTYDNLDRLSSEITPQGVISYSYDILGRRNTMSVNGSLPVNYSYDANSRLTQVAQGAQIVGLNYDLAGRRTSLIYPNNTNTTYAYDNASRLTNITHQNGTTPFESITYTYDAAGNRISLDRTNGASILLPDAVQAAYDAANEQIQFNNATPNLTYDANGNLTSQTDPSGTTTYTWDARNRLSALSRPSTTASFVYDALARRSRKTINGVQTDFQYDGNDIVVEIGGGAIGASYLRSLSIDEPFIRESATNEYYHVDVLGSTLELTDAAGAVSTSYEYEAFGKTTINGTSSNPFQYTGRENDGTGLYYYRARYYSKNIQRFITEDPIVAPYTPLSLGQCKFTNFTIWTLPGAVKTPGADVFQYLNAYAYVSNNPVQSKDPSGLFFFTDRSCNDVYNKCLNDIPPQDREVRSCVGTKYLQLGAECEEKSHGNKQCRMRDLEQSIDFCFKQKGRNPPKSCSENMRACISKQK
jgi:RHS repeat-associated protein